MKIRLNDRKGRMKKNTLTGFATFTGALAIASGTASAAISIVGTTEPTSNVLYDGIIGTSRANGIVDSDGAPGSRGSGFRLDTGTFSITSIVMDVRGALAANNITVSIFEGSPYDKTYTAIGGTIVDSGDFATATGLTLAGEETFTTAGLATTNAHFISFDFTTAIDVTAAGAGTPFAIFISTDGTPFNYYDGTSNTGATIPTAVSRFQMTTSTTTTGAEIASSRDLRFSVIGVPEPSVALLGGLGILGLLRRRRD